MFHNILVYTAILLSSFLLISTLGGCEKTGPTPSFLQIDTVLLQTDAGQGNNLHNINSAWVFLNNEELGAFELPATIPVIATGEQTIRILAGINNNGIAATKGIYPFYSTYETSVNFTELATNTIAPTVSYRDFTRFAFIADFESGNIFSDVNQAENLFNTTSNPAEVFQGLRSAKITLTEANTQFDIQNINTFEFEGSGRAVFLEMHYKCEAPFEVLLQGYNPTDGGITSSSILAVNTKNTWNKIYINLGTPISSLVAGGYTLAAIRMRGFLPLNEGTATFYWDNIQLIYEE